MSVLEMAQQIWKKIHGEERPFHYVSDPPFRYDVQRRIPDTSKAKRLLGFEATTDLDAVLDEVVPWVAQQLEVGAI